MILDSSRSIFEIDEQLNLSPTVWNKEKDVLYKIVDGLAIGPNPNDSKVALVKYAAKLEDRHEMTRELMFKDNTDKLSVLATVLGVQPFEYRKGPGNGGSATPEAIHECLAIFRNDDSTTEVPKVIVVFTDGVTHYYNMTEGVARHHLREAVQHATDAGVTNYAVVFNSNSRTDEAMLEARMIAQNVTKHRFYGETPNKIASVLHCKGKSCVHALYYKSADKVL